MNWRGHRWPAMVREIRYAWRGLARAPALTTSAVLLLAIGIGATTATYSVLDTAVLRPLPYPSAERLVTVEHVDFPYDFGPRTHKPRVYTSDLRELGVFSGVATYAVGAMNFGGEDVAARVSIAYVSPEFFQTMGRVPRLGRSFTADEGTSAGDNHVAILSHRLWVQEFAGSTAAVGTPFTLNGRRFRVIGIMPPDFAYPSNPDLWLPMPVPISNPEIFEAFGMFIPTSTVARLKTGVSLRVANTAVARIEREYPTWSFVSDSAARELVRPLQASLLGASARQPLIALGAAAGLVLLLSCANLAALLAARNIDRRRELEVRLVLGASRAHLAAQPIAEVLLLSLGGTVAGLLIAAASMGALGALLPPNLLAIARPKLDTRLLLFAIVISAGVATTITTAIVAKIGRATTYPLGSSGSRSSSRGSRAARELLGAGEIALALVLVVAAGLMLDSLRRLTSVDTGLRLDGVAVAQLTLPRTSYPTPDEAAVVVQQCVARLSAMPGIRSASAVDVLPIAGRAGFGVVMTLPDNPADSLFPLTYSATPGYFASMGVPLLRGRDFRWTDRPGDAILINALAARQLWADGDAVGRRVVIGNKTRTIIGVVGNVRTKRLGDTAVAQVYVPFAEGATNTVNIVVNAATSLDLVADRIRHAVRSGDPGLPVYGIRRMDDVVAASIAGPRVAGTLLGMFSATALILAGIGVYGITAHNVAARRREFAVRLAVGADPFELLVRILRRAALTATLGIVSGITLAAVASRLIANLLFEVSPLSIAVFAVSAAVLFGTVLLGALGPALRGIRTDPIQSLRAE